MFEQLRPWDNQQRYNKFFWVKISKDANIDEMARLQTAIKNEG